MPSFNMLRAISFFPSSIASSLYVDKTEQAFFASIPYDLEENKDKDEKYYQMIFYILFTVIG